MDKERRKAKRKETGPNEKMRTEGTREEGNKEKVTSTLLCCKVEKLFFLEKSIVVFLCLLISRKIG